MDMLRNHKLTIGWAWDGNHGSCDDPEELKTLLACSPLHTIKPGASYSPVLVTTADHDDRVVPAQLQVHRRAAGGAGRAGADPHPHRDPRRVTAPASRRRGRSRRPRIGSRSSPPRWGCNSGSGAQTP
jgi:hypothetical protein